MDSRRFDILPQWSPDGARLALQGGTGIHVIDRDGETRISERTADNPREETDSE
jgi:Tol biopolymer transport system component